jgi:hypothetical protein
MLDYQPEKMPEDHDENQRQGVRVRCFSQKVRQNEQ